MCVFGFYFNFNKNVNGPRFTICLICVCEVLASIFKGRANPNSIGFEIRHRLVALFNLFMNIISDIATLFHIISQILTQRHRDATHTIQIKSITK